MGSTTRRWTPDEIRTFLDGGTVFARDQQAALVALPPWLAGIEQPPSWDEQVSWIHIGDRSEVVAAWWRAVSAPAEPSTVRFRSTPDGGATWHQAEARYLNLLDHPDVGSVLIAHFDHGPTDPPDDLPDDHGAALYEAPIWIIQHLDPVGAVLRTEGNVEEVFGRPAESLVGRNVLDWLHPADHDAAIAMWLEVVSAPAATRTIRQRMVRPDGAWVWLESTVMNQLAETGAVVAVSHDVSDRQRQEAALRASEQEFRALAEGVPVAVFRASATGQITFANTLWHELVAPFGEVSSVLQLAAADDVELVAGQWSALVTTGAGSFEVDLDTDDGRCLRLRCRLVPPVTGEPVVIGTLDDVSAELALTDELRLRAEQDALTGLVNRPGFDRLATEALLEHSDDVALVFVDLDGFKAVNDTWGHVAGDSVLRAVAERLRSVVRPGDVVARYGGDEFVLLCSGVRAGEDAAIAARIEIALDRPIPVEATHWRQAASVGVVRPRPDEAPADALHRADEEMYRRKRGRRSRST